MKYKEGDKVRIKTWDELVAEFGVDERKYINDIYWHKDFEVFLPKDRIISIVKIREDMIIFNNTKKSIDSVSIEMIKCYANEYYLQQIKEEL